MYFEWVGYIKTVRGYCKKPHYKVNPTFSAVCFHGSQIPRYKEATVYISKALKTCLALTSRNVFHITTYRSICEQYFKVVQVRLNVLYTCIDMLSCQVTR